MTELTESSPYVPPPSVLCGSGVFSRLSSRSMASSGHFDSSQTYDGYKAVEYHYCLIGKRPCCHTGVTTSNVRRYLWSRKDGPFGSEFPVSEAPTPDGPLGFSNLTGSRQRDVAKWTNVGGPIPVGGRPINSSSEVPISRINTEGVVKRIRMIADSPTDPDAEVGHPSSTSSSQPLANRFQSQVIPSTPRTFQTVLASIPTTLPPDSPSTSNARPDLNQAVRPSPTQQPRNSPITTSQQLQPMILLAYPNAESENQKTVARLFRRVDGNSREVIMYANDRNIPGTASEEMAAKFAWYVDELINDFQRTFDDSGRDN
ncbi:hypothetical protein O181_100815 [Austropuccinia psidii MF-1]|uniref:Uncharacterized protein n=1 Tax=Austropuccinia psidii MF-1 TaxID=1389203 RepID=A0A9Q3JGC1_9BASI|nr:hypothetical protein [Austropuccinia psidii MF-1]